MEASAMIFVLVALVPICGIMMALTPSFMPRSECFTVTIPEVAQEDPCIVQMKGTYRKVILALTAVVTVMAAVLVPGAVEASNSVAFTVAYTAAVMIPLIVGFLLMLMYRGRIMGIKEAEGWKAQTQASTTVVGNDASPQPLGMGWSLLYAPVLVLSAVIIYVLYPMMPDQLPMQVGFNGEVTSSVAKSPLAACFPLFVNLFVAVVMVFTNWSIGRSKRAIDPKKPATSAYAYGAFAKAQSVLLFATGLTLTAAIGVLIPLSFAGVMSMMTAGLLVAVLAIAIVAVVMVVSLKYGQSGSRVFEGSEDGVEMSRDEDAYWKLGTFYVNSADPAVFVPKRFGFGWTLNLGRPGTWLILAALIAFIAGFAVLTVVIFE